jgi:hypothetical protein
MRMTAESLSPFAAAKQLARRSGLCLLVALSCLPTSGCAKKRVVPWGTVEGTATLDGQPVNQGTIVFDNAELGVSRMAELQSDGHFVQSSVDFAGLPVGKYRVALLPTGISKGDWVPVQKSSPQKVVTVIPARYQDLATSGLTADVKEGKNQPFNFELQK